MNTNGAQPVYLVNLGETYVHQFVLKINDMMMMMMLAGEVISVDRTLSINWIGFNINSTIQKYCKLALKIHFFIELRVIPCVIYGWVTGKKIHHVKTNILARLFNVW